MRILSILILLLFHLPGSGQAVGKISKLKIGDTFPELTLSKSIARSSTRGVAELKSKTTILYLWNTECESCLQDWPRFSSLQKIYNPTIQIIVATEAPKIGAVRKTVNQYRSHSKSDSDVPVIGIDSALNQYFPARTYPRLVWIDPSGKIIAITHADQFNNQSIASLTEGRQLNVIQCEGVKYNVDYSKPLFVKSNGGDGNHLEWHSVVSNYFPGIYGTMSIDSCYGILSNLTLTTMFRFLFKGETNSFGALNLFPVSRVQLKVRDTLQYLSRINGKVQEQNYYTYQLYSKKPRDYQTLRNTMLSEIKRYFAVDCYWSRQRKPCLVLTSLDTARISSNNGDVRAILKPSAMDLNNVTVKEVIENLLAFTDYHTSPYPIIDETGIKGKIGNIKFEGDIKDYRNLDKSLQAFGLRLTLEPREVTVLVIYEPEYHIPEQNSVIAN